MKKCPVCSTENKDVAKKCAHCSSDFGLVTDDYNLIKFGKKVQSKLPAKMPENWSTWVIGGAFLLLLLRRLFIRGGEPGDESGAGDGAIEAARNAASAGSDVMLNLVIWAGIGLLVWFVVRAAVRAIRKK